MDTTSHFWICVRELAQSYDDAGLTPEERADEIVSLFRQQPTMAHDELQKVFRKVMLLLPVVQSLVSPAK